MRKIFSILANELEYHEIEQLHVCIRFVDKYMNIQEGLLEFGNCKQVTGEEITEEINCILGKCDVGNQMMVKQHVI